MSGGAGFIGSATVEKLVEYRGDLVEDVIVIDNFSSGDVSNLSKVRDRVDIFKFDIRFPLFGVIRGDVDYILHLAAVISLEEVERDPVAAVEVNVKGTLNMLELARRVDVERFVYASSVAVYGEPRSLPIREDHPTSPVNLYGLTKLMGEQLVRYYSREYGIRTVILRYFNVYGPRMRGGPYSGVAYKFISSLLRGEPPVIYGDGLQTRDFVYVYDVAEANVKALFLDRSARNVVLNIGTGRETRILDLLRIISRIMNVTAKPVFKPPRKGDVRRSAADTTLAEEVLGWRPKVTLEEGLSRTISWLQARMQGLSKTK